MAIAATLLVLNLHVPRDLTGARLHQAVSDVLADLLSAGISFLVIGALWMGHHALWRKIETVDRRLLTLNLAFLGPVVLIPFTAQVLSAYTSYPAAPISYATVLVVASIAEILVWRHAVHAGHVHPGVSRIELDRGHVRPLALAVVFAASIPVALVAPEQAPLVWLALVVVMPMASRRYGPPDTGLD